MKLFNKLSCCFASCMSQLNQDENDIEKSQIERLEENGITFPSNQCHFHDLPETDNKNGLWEVFNWVCTDAAGNHVTYRHREIYGDYIEGKDLWNSGLEFNEPIHAGGQCNFKCGSGYQDSLCKWLSL